MKVGHPLNPSDSFSRAELISPLLTHTNALVAKKREILSAASAAGMSVAFGAPIGGVLFSLEQVSYYFPDKVMWHAFVCAMIAAVSLQAINPFRTGKLVLWQVTYDRNWHDFEIWSFVVIGLMGVCDPSPRPCNLFGLLFLSYLFFVFCWRGVFEDRD